jgi:hypothetical protein
VPRRAHNGIETEPGGTPLPHEALPELRGERRGHIRYRVWVKKRPNGDVRVVQELAEVRQGGSWCRSGD